MARQGNFILILSGLLCAIPLWGGDHDPYRVFGVNDEVDQPTLMGRYHELHATFTESLQNADTHVRAHALKQLAELGAALQQVGTLEARRRFDRRKLNLSVGGLQAREMREAVAQQKERILSDYGFSGSDDPRTAATRLGNAIDDISNIELRRFQVSERRSASSEVTPSSVYYLSLLQLLEERLETYLVGMTEPVPLLRAFDRIFELPLSFEGDPRKPDPVQIAYVDILERMLLRARGVASAALDPEEMYRELFHRYIRLKQRHLQWECFPVEVASTRAQVGHWLSGYAEKFQKKDPTALVLGVLQPRGRTTFLSDRAEKEELKRDWTLLFVAESLPPEAALRVLAAERVRILSENRDSFYINRIDRKIRAILPNAPALQASVQKNRGVLGRIRHVFRLIDSCVFQISRLPMEAPPKA